MSSDGSESRSERIDRLLAEGILTPAQAGALRDGLAGPVRPPDTRPASGHRPPWFAWLAIGVIVAVALLAIVAGGDAPDQAVQNVAQTLNQAEGIGAMNRPLTTVLAVAIILVVPLLIWMWLHNSIVAKEEAVFESWAQVESNYQRRSDLIPRLVETVSRYLRHESETLTAVTRERAKAANPLSQMIDELAEAQKASTRLINEHGAKLIEDEKGLAALGRSQKLVGEHMRRILGIAESYPELRSSDQFLELQGQLEGTENRINVARVRFNEAVSAYNRSIRYLPGSLVASVGRFRRKAYFEADDGAERAAPLKFD